MLGKIDNFRLSGIIIPRLQKPVNKDKNQYNQ